MQYKCEGGDFTAFVGKLTENEPELAQKAELALTEMGKTLDYLHKMLPKALLNIEIDFSLARGLDYYTGMIFEAKLASSNASIAGGGRYDNLLN